MPTTTTWWDQSGAKWDAVGLKWDVTTPAALFSGAVLGTATLTGSLAGAAASLSGGSIATAVMMAGLTTVITLRGTVLATAVGTGSLTAVTTLAGTALATAMMTGDLTAIPLSLKPLLRTYTVPQSPVRASWPTTHTSTTPASARKTAELVTIDG